MRARFTFVDLFAGIGGFRLALQGVGGECLGFSEIAGDAINAYCTNFGETEQGNLGDITKLQDVPKHDLMTAGVPCQSWSIAGKNLGFDDDRGQLWNDTLFLLSKARPKAFIFENVKGLADPRNGEALNYIMERIARAGYHAERYLLNACDYGVPQTRVRIYIVGFAREEYHRRFHIPAPRPGRVRLGDVLDGVDAQYGDDTPSARARARWSLSCNSQGFNDYFLFNDLRNGDTTVHSWDIAETSDRQKDICMALLHNRRKSKYGILDGNALSLDSFRDIDRTITREELERLVDIGILKRVPYYYDICKSSARLTEEEAFLLSFARGGRIMVDRLRLEKEFRRRKISIQETLRRLEGRRVVKCSEMRYDFRNAKISTGLNGINRIFLPSSRIYPTLVASDTNDYVATEAIRANTPAEWKEAFMRQVYKPGKFRKITKPEACRIQGFPADFVLPEARARWMRLIGNSVAVPVVRMLAEAVVNTGVFGEADWDGKTAPATLRFANQEAESTGGRYAVSRTS